MKCLMSLFLNFARFSVPSAATARAQSIKDMVLEETRQDQ